MDVFTFVVSKVLGGFFVSSETVATLMGPVGSLRIWAPWSKGVHPSKSIKLNAAIFSQKEKNLYYNLRSRSKNQSTPKSKVDACVECDFPFDESKISPELRRGPVTKERTSSELLEPSHKNSVGFNKTNL